MLTRVIATLAVVVLTLPGLVGCAAATVDNTEVTLQTALPAQRVTPPQPGKNTIWVEWQDQTGQGLDLFEDIIAAVEDKGYVYTDDFFTADYALWATLRIFDEADENFDNRMARLGGIAGGAAIGTTTAVLTDNWWAGAGAGFVGGAITGEIVRRATAEVTWAMVIDVQLGRQLASGPIETDLDSRSDANATSASALAGPMGAEGGRSTNSAGVSQRAVEERTRFELEQRILAFSKGRRLERDVAREAMMPRLQNSLSELLPRARRARR